MAAGDLSWWPHACAAAPPPRARAEFCNFWVSFYRMKPVKPAVKGKYSVGVELRKNIYFPRAQRAETGAERPFAALLVYSVGILSCFAGKVAGAAILPNCRWCLSCFSSK